MIMDKDQPSSSWHFIGTQYIVVTFTTIIIINKILFIHRIHKSFHNTHDRWLSRLCQYISKDRELVHSHHLPRQPVLLLDSSHWHKVSSTRAKICLHGFLWAQLCPVEQHNTILLSFHTTVRPEKKKSCPCHILFSSHSLPCTHSHSMIYPQCSLLPQSMAPKEIWKPNTSYE